MPANALHKKVCNRTLTLRAQKLELAYKRKFG